MKAPPQMETENRGKNPFTLHLTTDEEKWPKCDMSNVWNLKYAINGENGKKCCYTTRKNRIKNIFYGYGCYVRGKRAHFSFYLPEPIFN